MEAIGALWRAITVWSVPPDGSVAPAMNKSIEIPYP